MFTQRHKLMFIIALYNSPKLKSIYILAHLYLHTMELVFSNKKEWTTDIPNNIILKKIMLSERGQIDCVILFI